MGKTLKLGLKSKKLENFYKYKVSVYKFNFIYLFLNKSFEFGTVYGSNFLPTIYFFPHRQNAVSDNEQWCYV